MSCGGFRTPGMPSCGCGGSGRSCSCGSKHGRTASSDPQWTPPGYSSAGAGMPVYRGPVGGSSVPGMSQATAAQLPVLLHPPAFMPPGMLGALSGWQTTARGRGASGSEALPAVTVSGKDCAKVITLSVHIVKGSDSSGRGRRLLERVQKLLPVLSEKGKWNCCKDGKARCAVKLALEIVDVTPDGAGKPWTTVRARFYNGEKERASNMSPQDDGADVGVNRDAFGLWRPATGTIEIPSITEEMLSRSHETGGLNGLSPEALPPNHPQWLASTWVVGASGGAEIGWPLDVLAVIIHEILHAMGAGHDDDKDKNDNIIPNIMNQTWQTDNNNDAFRITQKTACEIASKNGVCTGAEEKKCCVAEGAPANKLGKPGLHATTSGFVVPGMSGPASMGAPARVGYWPRQWATRFPQEGRYMSSISPSDMRWP